MQKPAAGFAQVSFKRIGYSRPARLMDTPLRRFRGLMFKRKVEEPLLFIFPSANRHANAIHSFFCPRFDAAFISKANKVLDYFPNVAPNQPLIVPSGQPSMLIEAPANSLKGLKPGDSLTLRL